MLDNKTIVVYGLPSNEVNLIQRASLDFKVDLMTLKTFNELYDNDYFLAVLNINELSGEELDGFTDYLENIDPNLTTKVVLDAEKRNLSDHNNYISFTSFQGIENELSVLVKKAVQKAKRELNSANNSLKLLTIYNYLQKNSGSAKEIAAATKLEFKEVKRYLGVIQIICKDIQFDKENNSYFKKGN